MLWGRSWGRHWGALYPILCSLILLFCDLSCSTSDRSVIYVTLIGLSADTQTVGVALTLDRRVDQTMQPTLKQNLSQFQIRTPPDTKGTLGIQVTAQGPDGCTSLAGSSELVIDGVSSQNVTINMTSATGCQLTVRKVGDGAAEIVLSDETTWDFSSPEPPSDGCPVESLVASEQSKTFALGTVVTVSTASNDFTRGSYVIGKEGCGDRPGECKITIGPDTQIVTLVVGRTSVCSADGVCWEHPLPQGQDLLRSYSSSASDVWAVGDGNILHYNGSYWAAPRRIALPSAMTGVLASNPNNIVVVGRGGYVLRLSENQWLCPERPTPIDLNDVWGPSLDDYWAVGGSGTLLHWANKTWTPASVPGVTQELRAVRGRGDGKLWAIGDSGTVLYYDGASWNKIPFPTTDALYGLWLDNIGRAWVVGDRGVSARITGTQVEVFSTGFTTRLRSIYAIGEQEIWAAGDAGVLLRFLNNSWSIVESGTRQNLYSIGGASDSSLWVVGGGGTILHYGGLYWTPDSVGRTARPLYGLSGINNTASRTVTALFAVGEQGTVLRNTGADWVADLALSGLTPRTLRAVSTPSNTEIWIAGDAGTILSWDGSQVGMPGVGTGADFYGVWAGSGSVAAVGTGGMMARRSGTTWISAALPSAGGRTLRAVWGTAANALWLAGDSGTLLFWNGTSANSVPTGVTVALRGVWGTASNNVWAVGDAGQILRYDGTSWSLHAQGSKLTTQNLNAVGGASADEVYAAGENGALLRFNGTVWSVQDSSSLGALNAMWGGVTGDTRMVGSAGTILLHRPER